MIIRQIQDHRFAFWCPGCNEVHCINDTWTFNNNFEKPTFSPSILMTSGHYVPGWKGPQCWCTYNKEHADKPSPFQCRRCHSFVKDGQIQFLNDCTHSLAGKTVPLQNFLP